LPTVFAANPVIFGINPIPSGGWYRIWWEKGSKIGFLAASSKDLLPTLFDWPKRCAYGQYVHTRIGPKKSIM
jgi:hypothetical protein